MCIRGSACASFFSFLLLLLRLLPRASCFFLYLPGPLPSPMHHRVVILAVSLLSSITLSLSLSLSFSSSLSLSLFHSTSPLPSVFPFIFYLLVFICLPFCRALFSSLFHPEPLLSSSTYLSRVCVSLARRDAYASTVPPGATSVPQDDEGL